MENTAGRLAKRAQELIKVVADKKGDPRLTCCTAALIKVAQWLSGWCQDPGLAESRPLP